MWCGSHCDKSSLLQSHWGRWRYTRLLWPACLFTDHVGSLPPCSPLEPSSQQSLLQVFPLQGSWAGANTPAFSGQLVYLQFCEGLPLPHSSELRVPVSFCCCCLFSLVFFSFSLGGGPVCPRGYADLTQGCLWEYHMPLSSPGGLLLLSQ
jgi:hypothetical protein